MGPTEQQVLVLSSLLQLEKQARDCGSLKQLIFLIVNETLKLIRYNRAILWRNRGMKRVRIDAVSGIDRPEQNAPLTVFNRRLVQHLLQKLSDGRKITPFSINDVDDSFRPGWQEWKMGYLVLCPLADPFSNEVFGGMLFSRNMPWEEAELSLLERLSQTYSHAWAALQRRRRLPFFLRIRWGVKFIQAAALAAIIWLLMQPVSLSVLAPAEIVPVSPVMVTAATDGVISEIYVEPNQYVVKGTELLRLDETTTRNNYEVARKSLAVAEAELRRASQKAFMDEESRSRIQYLQAEIEQKKTEVSYMAELLERGRLRSEKDGIVVFSDINEWLGKPVVVGERIMTLADPDQVEAEINLPVTDAINLEPGARVMIFLNISPDDPIEASLRQASYEAAVTPDGILAFRLKAQIRKGEISPRVGLRGTAKLYGEEVSLFYYLMRRPLITLRQTVGM